MYLLRKIPITLLIVFEVLVFSLVFVSLQFYIVDKVILLSAAGAIFLTLVALIAFTLRPLELLVKNVKLLVPSRISVTNPEKLSEIGLLSEVLNQLIFYSQETAQKIISYQTLMLSEKKKLETIINSIGEGIIAIDTNKNVVLANKSVEKITGFNPGELLNRQLNNLIFVESENGTKLPLQFFCDEQGPKPPQAEMSAQMESFTLLGKNNSKRPVRINSAWVDPNTGSNLRCVLILTDLRLENELRSLQVDFVSMASHELRTPLTSILGYLSVFMDENKNKLDSGQKAFLDRVVISARQLSSLIENLLNVSKVERSTFNLQRRPLDLQQLLSQVVADNQLQASQKNHILSLELPSKPLPKVLADPIRIVEVLNNLLSNAINYTKEGGKITVGAVPYGNEVITSVKDTGVGIPKSAQYQLFTKFFRVEHTLAPFGSIQGAGLGLYLSKSIIDMHKGKIWVESDEGKGSTFYFTLPIA